MAVVTQYDPETAALIKIDRVVTGFGGATYSIRQPVGTPRPREACTPFTFMLATGDARRAPDLKAQESFVKKLNTLTAKQAREQARRDKAAAKLAKVAA